MEIVINGTSITAQQTYKNRLEVTIDGVEKNDILSLLDIDDVIDYFGKDKLLDEIGEEAAIKNFNLKLAEE